MCKCELIEYHAVILDSSHQIAGGLVERCLVGAPAGIKDSAHTLTAIKDASAIMMMYFM